MKIGGDMTIKFIHCADLHLGSPFKGISSVNPALGAALAAATFGAFRNIVDAALGNRVDFLLIAGDVFDNADRSLRSRLFFRKQLERLASENISCFIACGNHDPLPSWSKTLELPANTTIFGADAVRTVTVECSGRKLAAVSGISFGTDRVETNLAVKFTPGDPELPAIALLHANIENSSQLNYAPAKLSDLEAAGCDYWALGHAHSFKIIKAAFPAVVYPGCPQGTSPREIGEKGCCLVELTKGQVPVISALPTAEIRYADLKIDLQGIAAFEQLFELVNQRCEQLAANCRTVLRLELTGRTELDHELRQELAADELDEHLSGEVAAFGDMLFLNHTVLSTRGNYDLDSLSANSGFVSDLLASAGTLTPEDIAGELTAVYKKCRCLPKFTDEELRAVITDAGNLALDKLLTEFETETGK
ncbi:MAG: DNA repair exonuclease [Victivallales bacterium]|nr:DNA repair exonuclease [Victivallales bacterium]